MQGHINVNCIYLIFVLITVIKVLSICVVPSSQFTRQYPCQMQHSFFHVFCAAILSQIFFCSVTWSLPLFIFTRALFMQNNCWNRGSVSFSLCSLKCAVIMFHSCVRIFVTIISCDSQVLSYFILFLEIHLSYIVTCVSVSINFLFLEFKLLALRVKMCCCGVCFRFVNFWGGRLKVRQDSLTLLHAVKRCMLSSVICQWLQ